MGNVPIIYTLHDTSNQVDAHDVYLRNGLYLKRKAKFVNRIDSK